MLYAFTDESYNNEFYFQAALVVDESNLHLLVEIVRKVLTRANSLGVDETAEIHGHSMMQGTHGWEALAGKYRIRKSVYRFLLQNISELDATLIIQGVQTISLYERFGRLTDPHLITFRNLSDALDIYATNRNQKVRIISDRIYSEAKIHRLFEQFKKSSTEGKYFSFLNEIIAIDFIDSHLSAGVQLTDVSLYIYNRMSQNQYIQSRASRDVIEMWEILAPLIKPGFEPRIWTP